MSKITDTAEATVALKALLASIDAEAAEARDAGLTYAALREAVANFGDEDNGVTFGRLLELCRQTARSMRAYAIAENLRREAAEYETDGCITASGTALRKAADALSCGTWDTVSECVASKGVEREDRTS